MSRMGQSGLSQAWLLLPAPLGFVIRDEAGRMIGAAAGYTWAGTSEFKQMWVDEACRGRGYAWALLNAFSREHPVEAFGWP
jgi:hypothetical protein